MTHPIVSRKDLRLLLTRWQSGEVAAPEVHQWAEDRFATDIWVPEDDVVNEVLGTLDMLDINLVIVEDIPVLLQALEMGPGLVDDVARLLEDHWKVIPMLQRAKTLVTDPLYASFAKAYWSR
ncbi:MAG TPA: hypothetical protein VJ486_03460 [Geothrix sp.]|nr:hypothetical protein [Geothrix sp.]